jgi:ring-1,2-phenylacetyl-CoA epoxidase subunit PaaD
VDGARAVAHTVTDPELPMLTLHDLGVLRGVHIEGVSLHGETDGHGDAKADIVDAKGGGTVVVEITPTYSGCPAMAEMRADLTRALYAAGFAHVEVRTVLSPPWTTDDITAHGREVLAEHGIAPPGPAPRRSAGPVPLTLGAPRTHVPCSRCGSRDTIETSRFGSTACKALYRCRACLEPFDHVKEI